MEKIKSSEVDKWSEPDENHRIKHLGMITRGEAFEQLKAHLESKGLLPDEYFLPGMDGKLEDELPDYDIAECVPNFGGSEGIYGNFFNRTMESSRSDLSCYSMDLWKVCRICLYQIRHPSGIIQKCILFIRHCIIRGQRRF